MKRAALAVLALSASPLLAGSSVVGSRAALATSSPYATRAGLDVLKRGGNAADAAVAAAFTLAVANPQSGLGGGGFLTYYDAASGAVWTLDFRETAPAAIKPGILGPKASGPITAGVPGTVAGLAAMHERFGALPWSELLAPAIHLARDGIPVSADLASDIARTKSERNLDPYPGLSAGSTLTQKDLAATLERIAAKGASDFYAGDVARLMVDALRKAGGIVGTRDLRDYKPVWRAPIRVSYREYDVYAPAPPSAAGVMIGETLNILRGFELSESAKTIHLLLEATRRAAIDRDRYVADPDVRRVPYRDLLSAERAQQWRSSIDPLRATPTATLGEPATAVAEGKHTTHFTIVDGQDNIASVTMSLGDDFGGGFLVPGCGFFLNDSMSDFAGDATAANSVQPGKRMASSMAPTIIFRKGKPYLTLGSSGGPAIPNIVLQVFLQLAVVGKSIDEAIAAPRYDQQPRPEDVVYEIARAPDALIAQLRAMGHGVRPQPGLGEVNAVLIERPKITAVADPRRGGAAGAF